MRLGDIRDFIKAKILTRPFDLDKDAEAKMVASKAHLARDILNSDLFVEAYQEEMASLVDQLLSMDMSVTADRERSLNLLAQLQGLQQLTRRLAGYVGAAEIQQQRARRAA